MSKFIRVFLVGVAPIALLGLGSQAYAQATDVVCDNCVDSSDIAGQAITSNKIKSFAINSSKIHDRAVNTRKIRALAVTTAKIDDGAVTTDKIADDAVTAAKIDSAAVGGGLTIDSNEVRVADGFVSIAANASYPRDSTIETDQATGDTGLGRYQTSAGSGFLVAPLSLPHGARIVSFTYRVFDNSATINSNAHLYRDCSGCQFAVLSSTGQSTSDQVLTNTSLNIVVDNSINSYWVYMGINGTAGDEIIPISAIIGYTFD